MLHVTGIIGGEKKRSGEGGGKVRCEMIRKEKPTDSGRFSNVLYSDEFSVHSSGTDTDQQNFR